MIAEPTYTHARRRSLGLALALLCIAAPAAHATSGGAALAPSTSASAASTTPEPATALPANNNRKPVASGQIRRAQVLLQVRSTGRHDTTTRKVVRRFQTLRGLNPYGVIDAATYVQIRAAFALVETGGSTLAGSGSGASTTTTESSTTSLPSSLAPITGRERAILDRIAQCESGGNPRAISSNGLYRGKYQFDRQTWASVGGSGDPAAASEAEQDQRAAILLRRRGTAPWPVCGR